MPKLDSLTWERVWLIPVSVLCLTVPIFLIRFACHEERVSAALPLTLYGAYAAGVAAILTMIAQRLYVMHEVRRFVFDIPILFMLASLFALPPGAATMLTNWLASVESAPDADAYKAMTPMFAMILYFLIFPVFFVTEAIMALARVVARKVRRPIMESGR